MILCAVVALSALAAAPSGQIAFVALEGGARQVGLLDLASGDVRLIGPGMQDGAPVWSPDGARIAFATGDEQTRKITVGAPVAGALEELPSLHGWNNHPQWSADGRALAYEAAEAADDLPRLAIYHLETGRETFWAAGKKGFLRPVWLPNLDLRLFLDPNRELSIEGVDLGQLWAEAEPGPDTIRAVLALGVTHALGRVSTEIYVVTETQVMPLLLDMVSEDSDRFSEWACAIDRAGRQVAFESNDGGDREIYLLGSSGLINLSNHRNADWHPVWSPRKNWLAFESFRGGRQGVYTVYTKTANVRPIAAGDRFDARSPTWSPDGKWLAYVVDEGTRSMLHVRAFAEDAPAIKYPLPSSGVAAPAWRPESKP